MKKRELLSKLGLTKKESAIYLALLKTGKSLISDISKNSGLYRTDVYKNIKSLKSKSLVDETIVGKRKYLIPAAPKNLKRLVDDLYENFNSSLPELEKTYNTRNNKPIVTFQNGNRGIQNVYDDVIESLNKGDVFYRYSSSKSSRPRNKYVSKDYEVRRDKKKLERYVITNKVTAEKKKPKLERYYKIVPPEYDLFQYNITELIYKDKVAFIDYDTETATTIKNPMIAEFQRKLFKLLFNKI